MGLAVYCASELFFPYATHSRPVRINPKISFTRFEPENKVHRLISEGNFRELRAMLASKIEERQVAFVGSICLEKSFPSSLIDLVKAYLTPLAEIQTYMVKSNAKGDRERSFIKDGYLSAYTFSRILYEFDQRRRIIHELILQSEEAEEIEYHTFMETFVDIETLASPFPFENLRIEIDPDTWVP